MTTQEKRKRLMLLVLPPLIILFTALGFYALGGGRGDAGVQDATVSKGINTQLPGAQLKKDEAKDKMSLYNQAQHDSVLARSKSDSGAFAALGWDTSKFQHPVKTPPNSASTNEAKINERLAQINRQINRPDPVAKQPPTDDEANAKSAELHRLEKLIKQKQQTGTPDPQMQQLNAMLDKIMAIQNPSSVKDKPELNKPVVKDSAFKAIPAIIDGNQKVAPGGVVKLRLQDTIHINGLTIPKGQTVFGSCAITNQRLLLDIRNIRLGTAIIPVILTVFSLDGMAGIAAPEAELGEAAGGGANGALENMQFLSMDNSLSTQAATAGISAAKGLLSKKVQKIRVKLKGGQTVLLRINKS
ncbi:conjugative transposon protein TraM [Mucilaginibacter sp.]|uniref:conjugative transposon protein TraM n=1 Tax=Mucilaginibacter sp. TaxID=1882438 RepID=UPI002608EB72|nr:conjugative transposon protein TraM [Mucilaginibacter sp.]MDB4926592.1 Conjugative transposon TraM protein [Mucilaginibacter sp.]